ncbi:hypothetical protein FJNA_01720 [Thermus sp. FJN-A]
MLKDRCSRWLAYERYCARVVVEALRSVPESRKLEPSYQRAITLLGHIAAALEVWLARVEERQALVELHPADLSLEEVDHRLGEVLDRWERLLAQLNPEELEGTVHYQTTSGAWYDNTLEEIITHLFGHGAYHRGQIALLVRQSGGQPAATDFIGWLRS